MSPPRGRPPIRPEERRQERITVRLNAEERRRVEAAAQAAGVTPSTWLREAALSTLERGM
jgi:uncharacterized protein (DUF1778 family)